MDIKIAKKKDLSGILELYEQLHNGNASCLTKKEANKIWDEIDKNNIKYFLAKSDGKVLGSCYICIIPNLTYSGKSIGYIENLITDESNRRKGIGKRLIQKAIEYANENNCYKVVLQSGLKREEAHKFYEKMGFNGKTKIAYELRF
ncbi:MAG: GNAT family N-acetyltransferase [Treponema sp.]|nr:GNAT family N-acetyltransferase [Treponema sp.]